MEGAIVSIHDQIRLTSVVASSDAQFLLDVLEASASGLSVLVASFLSEFVVVDLFFEVVMVSLVP